MNVIMIVVTIVFGGTGVSITQTATEVSTMTCQKTQEQLSGETTIQRSKYSPVTIIRKVDCINIKK